jgi:hypothetical protein
MGGGIGSTNKFRFPLSLPRRNRLVERYRFHERLNGGGWCVVLLSAVVDAIPPPERLIVLQHIPEETMESYVMRSLPDLEIEPLEVHLYSCRECRNHLVTVLSAAEEAVQT